MAGLYGACLCELRCIPPSVRLPYHHCRRQRRGAVAPASAGSRQRRPRVRGSQVATSSAEALYSPPVKQEEVEERDTDAGLTTAYVAALSRAAVFSALARSEPLDGRLSSDAEAAQQALALARDRLGKGAQLAPVLPFALEEVHALPGADPHAGRVVEDRRYGIYDVRRYVHTSSGGAAGVKRSHGGASDSGSEEVGAARRPGSRRRLRRRAGLEDYEDDTVPNSRDRCHGCGVGLGPGGAPRAARYAYLCAECEPAGLCAPGTLGSGGLHNSQGVHSAAEDHVGRVLSAARQLSMEGGLDRFGSMNDSLVLDIAEFMEVLPLSSLTPRKAEAAPLAGASPQATVHQPLSPLPVWGTKRTRRQRQNAQEAAGRVSFDPARSGDAVASDEEDQRRSATDSAVRQLAAALPPELALPPGALLEMYRSLGGPAATMNNHDGPSSAQPPVDSVAMAFRRRAGLIQDHHFFAADDQPPLRGHAFQPVPPLRVLRGGSRSPTPPLPDAAVTPPAELMRGTYRGRYHHDAYNNSNLGWGAPTPAYGFAPAAIHPTILQGRLTGFGRSIDDPGSSSARQTGSNGLLLEALAAGLDGTAREQVAGDLRPSPTIVNGNNDFYATSTAPRPLWLAGKPEPSRAGPLAARVAAAAGGSYGAQSPPWQEPRVDAGERVTRHESRMVSPPSPAMAQEAVAAVVAAMTAWS